MKKEDIKFDDFDRWLFGTAPPEFMLEVFIRTFLIFLFLLLVVRMMGSRMAGQVTLTELSVMITLGAIVSPAMQLPDRGLLFGVIALCCAYIFQRGINLWAFNDQRIEKLTQGTLNILVRDGRIDSDAMRKARITRQQLYAMLRQGGIYNLGNIERVYLEACGMLSVYQRKEPLPGLPISPQTDHEIMSLQQQVDSGKGACENCGNVQMVNSPGTRCENCGAVSWADAYLQRQST